MSRVGIYKATDRPGVFFDAPTKVALGLLIEGAIDLDPEGPGLIDPPNGTVAKRIGEVVVRAVEDADAYRVAVAAEDVGKPEVRRKPPGEPGTWAIQSVIFAKDSFTPEQARTWIKDHSDRFGNYGMDESINQLRFRQYDPKWFNDIRIIVLTDGVTAAYGRIAAERQKDDEAVEKMFIDAWARYDAMIAVNKMIIKAGLLVVGHSTEVIQKDDGTQEEERYVLSMVLEPNDGQDGAPLKPDTQNDIYSRADICKGAHNWMENGGRVDLMHNWKPFSSDDVRPCESYLAPVNFSCGEGDRAYKVLKGSWMLALRILNQELWKAVKEEKLGAFSIGGTADRTPVQPTGTGGADG
jgi:hypothetical protein